MKWRASVEMCNNEHRRKYSTFKPIKVEYEKIYLCGKTFINEEDKKFHPCKRTIIVFETYDCI